MRRRANQLIIVCLCFLLCIFESCGEVKSKEAEREFFIEKLYESYVLNKNTKKFHYPSCRSAKTIKDSNREEYTGTRDALPKRGYSPCKNCDP